MTTYHDETYSKGVLVASTVIDTDAGTLVRTEMGVEVERRPLTPDEALAYAPAPKSADEKLAEARAALAALDALPTPVLTADVVDLLDDLRSAL